MQFELCTHEDTVPHRDGLHKDDMDRWVVDVVCKDCDAEGVIIIGGAWPNTLWDAKTLPEWKALMGDAADGNQV